MRKIDNAIRCPDCHSNRPVYRSLEATNYWIEKGKVIEEITGYGVSCQDCGAVYLICASGAFKPHPESLPIGAFAHRSASSPTTEPAPEHHDPPATRRPVPRRPPRI